MTLIPVIQHRYDHHMCLTMNRLAYMKFVLIEQPMSKWRDNSGQWTS